MNEKVKEYIETKKDAENRVYEENKRKTLIGLGLFEKVYSPDNSYTEEYHYSEWDSVNSTTKYYKIVPVEITDEEYEEVKKYSEKDKIIEKSETNPIATALTVIAWILFIGGAIAGFVLGSQEVEKGYYYTYTETVFSITIALTYWCTSLISGTMFLGFAEIIKLLDAIKKKQ